MAMKDEISQLKEQTLLKIENCKSVNELEDIRIKTFGKKGAISLILKNMGRLDKEERPKMGEFANSAKNEIEKKLSLKKTALEDEETLERIEKEKIDLTMPGREIRRGKRHPLTIVLSEIEEIFLGMGFEVADGPEIETDYYNFEALNIPKNHPARDEQDTFYIGDSTLLRTQTSPVQIRVMQAKRPPIKIIAPGRVYRTDTADATHSPLFHQIEGLLVDKGVKMSDLKWVLGEFVKRLYGSSVKFRFRPHHFPFTEPSAEMDFECFACGGKGCSVCKGEGYIEILGCGMVHPKVLKECDVNSDEYSGFAFGMGLERIAMRRYGINDVRLFYENDSRFLEQFIG